VRLLLAVAVALGSLAACGSAPSRSDSPFCRKIAELRDANPLQDLNSDDEALDRGITIMRELTDVAPVALKDELRVVSKALTDLRARGPDAATGIVAQPGVISAARSIGQAAQRDCGVEGVFTGETQ
jgi:hypothetical protein